MIDDEKFDIEPFWLDFLRQAWIDSMDQFGAVGADDIDAQLRELFEEYPPIKTEGTWNIGPLVYGLARKTGRDPDELLEQFRRSHEKARDERADAIEAAEDLLRGDE